MQVDVLYPPFCQHERAPSFCFMPVGTIGLMNLLLDEGFTVNGINHDMEKALNPKFV